MDATLDETRHVSDVGPWSFKGWQTIAGTVVDADERKIQDCKEDIDTLLVFAGLFSAVTTAFIIESYKNLQEDPADVTVQLLRQIVAPSSTSPTMSTIDFQPTPAAIRVNVLWFASLIFSLVTASLGMLVKQWLREYLSGDYTSPLARLRLRRLRHSGLTHWKVFQIAAILPFLLQIALGLFLLGLCFFTWSIDTRIGSTCIPLVAGWSAFVLATAMVPIISVRCPYKTPILKDLAKFARPGAYFLVSRMRDMTSTTVQRIIRRFPRATRLSLHAKLSNLLRTNPYVFGPIEEPTVVRDSRADLEILVSIDAIIADDDVLCTAIAESLHSNPEPEAIVLFVRNLVGHRLVDQQTISIDKLPPNPPRLTPQVHNIIITAISHALDYELRGQTGESEIRWAPWIGDAIALLLYFSDSVPLTPHTMQLIVSYATCHRGAVSRALAFAIRTGSATDPWTLRNYIRRLSKIFPAFVDIGTMFALLEELVGLCVLRTAYNPATFRLASLLGYPSPLFSETRSLTTLNDVIIDMLHLEFTGGVEYARGRTWDAWIKDALSAIIRISGNAGPPCAEHASEFLSSVVRNNLVLEHQAPAVVEWLATEEPDVLESGWVRMGMNLLYDDSIGAIQALKNLCSVLQSRPYGTDPVTLGYIAITLLDTSRARQFVALWRSVFSALAQSIGDVNAQGHISQKQADLAGYCLWYIHTVDCSPSDLTALPGEILTGSDEAMLDPGNEALYCRWCQTFDERASFFPNRYIEVLSKIWKKGEGWYRVRLLRGNAGPAGNSGD